MATPTGAGVGAISPGKLPRLRFGKKQIFLPNFTLTLLRTPFLPPDYATFIVPLNLNKLDIKDYLYHAYGVRVISVRSYVQQQRVQQDKERAYDPKRNRWFRPRSIKKMTVQMDKGFVWPEEPTDFKPWDKDTHTMVKDAQDNEVQTRMPDAITKPTAERGSIAEQAKRLLRGEVRWKPQWEDYGAPVEVDRHQRV